MHRDTNPRILDLIAKWSPVLDDVRDPDSQGVIATLLESQEQFRPEVAGYKGPSRSEIGVIYSPYVPYDD